MKSKQAKLYIPVLYVRQVECKEGYTENKTTLLNASKIPILKDIVPDEETLQVHMQIQKIKVAKDANYKPVPFEICIESSIFTKIITEIKKVNKDFITDEHVALFTAWPAFPICNIVRK